MRNSLISNKRATVFSDRMIVVEEDGLFFSATEEEVIGVQHLLAEPECDKDTVDSILGSNVFSPHKIFDATDVSRGIEYNYGKLDGGAQGSDVTQEDKTKLEFIDGLLQITDGEALHASTDTQPLCEDYFLDDGSSKGHSLEQLSPGSEPLSLYRKTESATSITVLESTHTQQSFLLDKMTLLELHDAFMNMFGRKTLINEKQWLKNRIIFGLENLGTFGKNSVIMDHSFSTDEKESKLNVSLSDDLSSRVSSSYPDITMLEPQYENKDKHVGCGFSETLSSDVGSARIDSEDSEGPFITKRRSHKPVQRYADHSFSTDEKESNLNVSPSDDLSSRLSSSFLDITMLEAQYEKKDKHMGCRFSENLSSDVGSPRIDSEESEGPFITRRRLHKPVQRYANESLAQQSELQNKSCGRPYKKLRSPRSRFGKCYDTKKNVTNLLICREESFKEAIQVPFDFLIQKEQMKKSRSLRKHESDGSKDSNDMMFNDFSQDLEDETSEDESEDECMISTRKGKMKRKPKTFWTTSEMIQLTEGVSQYGVGKWSEIRKRLFSSDSPRTSVHLKDKWRNLLKAASSRYMINKKKVKQGGKVSDRKMQSILSRVAELAVLHPAKEGNLEGSCTTSIAPHTSASTGKAAMPSSFTMTGKYIKWFQK